MCCVSDACAAYVKHMLHLYMLGMVGNVHAHVCICTVDWVIHVCVSLLRQACLARVFLHNVEPSREGLRDYECISRCELSAHASCCHRITLKSRASW